MTVQSIRRPLSIGLAFLALVFCSPAATATTVLIPHLDELTARAGRIVLADVVAVRHEARPGRDGSLPHTIVALRTLRTIKGAVSLQLLLDFPGGHAGDTSLEVVGAPGFEVGQRNVLFLDGGPGGLALGPVTGIGVGRFLVSHDDHRAQETQTAVSWADGRPLVASTGQRVSLSLFLQVIERTVRRQSASSLETARISSPSADVPLIAPPLDAPPSGETHDGAVLLGFPSDRWPRPARVEPHLGSAPILLNGCPDWSCVVTRAVGCGMPAPSRVPARGLFSVEPGTPGSLRNLVLEIRWADEVLGHPLDDLTLAVTMRTVSAEARTVTLFLNRRMPWNAYDGPDRRTPAGDVVFDLGRVLRAELRQLFEADADAPAGGEGSGTGSRGSTAAAGDVSRASTWAAGTTPTRDEGRAGIRAADACEAAPASVVRNPRMISFESPDDAVMSGYEVGFFTLGAGAPDRVVELARGTFLERRVVDVPSDATASIRRPLVALITTAGLSTPPGVVYTYRVRGLWSGGQTAWSDASPPFTVCR